MFITLHRYQRICFYGFGFMGGGGIAIGSSSYTGPIASSVQLTAIKPMINNIKYLKFFILFKI